MVLRSSKVVVSVDVTDIIGAGASGVDIAEVIVKVTALKNVGPSAQWAPHLLSSTYEIVV